MSAELESPAFDVDRCIELHNQITRIGWGGSGQNPEGDEMQTWWEMYGADCDEQDLTPRLIPEVIDFLKGALQPDPDETGSDSPYQNFFYYIQGLAIPETILSENFILEGLDEDPPRYVLLYHVTDLKTHPCGIIFDQQTKKARTVFSITIDDTIVPEEERLWMPLQVILEQYLDMIELEKVIMTGDDAGDDSDDPVDEDLREDEKVKMERKPWILQSHSNKILERTLSVYQNLLRAIEARMPSPASQSPPSSPPAKSQLGEQNPITEAKDEDFSQAISALISSNQASEFCFVIKFLQQMAHPTRSQLKFLAPGLLLPTPELLSNQPFRNIDFHSSSYYNPVLLFPANNEDETTFPENNHNPFNYPYDETLNSYRSGLWISESKLEGGDFDDSCRLLLPRQIIDRDGEETEHHAKSADGFILEDVDGEGLAAGLYQTSCNPFILRHEVELFRVLVHWVQMVETGSWEVGAEGVSGGTEKWKEADESEEGSDRYRLELTW
ncbi:uncharacterized protein LY89DRAFT_784998 [Mollisia scopiformis]|uniref:Uncharacterized protein n=1 Tax=Mollisia scopiformis TaxID=149040 RepID=A0A194X069_MOLSC|nr:uncharacterized protein LY89DRAFT_784998 [Mollisia scopiformis]KUJ13267.1 hypothetical protein LY89DRAFT_784998 [Mollisia scopiformis]